MLDQSWMSAYLWILLVNTATMKMNYCVVFTELRTLTLRFVQASGQITRLHMQKPRRPWAASWQMSWPQALGCMRMRASTALMSWLMASPSVSS